MNISIFGLGYVGAVSSGCLANSGHHVIGVDPIQTKVDLINQGRSPIIEKDIGEIITKAVEGGRLRATSDTEAAIKETEISFVCVGTPSIRKAKPLAGKFLPSMSASELRPSPRPERMGPAEAPAQPRQGVRQFQLGTPWP